MIWVQKARIKHSQTISTVNGTKTSMNSTKKGMLDADNGRLTVIPKNT